MLLFQNSYSDYYIVVKVKAVDMDQGKNAEIRYTLKETTANEVSRIHTV